MEKYIYNGRIYLKKEELNQVLTFNNRSFKYGDGLFETIRVFEGKIPFLKLHFERLKKGMEVLSLCLPENFDLEFLKLQIEQILTHKKSNARIRLMVFRQAEGFYTPLSNQINFLIEISDLNNAYFELNKKSLTYGVFEDVKISPDILSNLKTNNSLAYILAANHKKKEALDEVLLINTSGRICEAIASNIFIQLADNQLITPNLREGCVAGTMRKVILEIAPKLGIKIIETTCQVAILKDAKEIFTSNAIQGIQTLKTRSNKNPIAQKFQQAINELVSAYKR